MEYHLSLTSPHPSTKPLFPSKPLFPKTRHTQLRFTISAKATSTSTSTATAPAPETAQKVTTMYDLLSVTESAGIDEIKAAYRQVARKWHPDTCRSDNKDFFTQQFIKAREAYEVLSDPVLREDYDYQLKNEINGGGMFKKSEITEGGFGDWETQLEALRRRSSNRATSSWGSRMRASSIRRS
eukprot:TRINITY_DN162_c0_g1_i3.p1 TRINITY_DN162_c0_g1~~TRINITY_DN162_c0_g1_i3.p1  ORF type:complete len:183 (-),score=12.58 TRINITY_DN162_c0_g1_i3:43-591(-)